jgi:hypothetical protein
MATIEFENHVILSKGDEDGAIIGQPKIDLQKQVFGVELLVMRRGRRVIVVLSPAEAQAVGVSLISSAAIAGQTQIVATRTAAVISPVRQ